MRDFLFSVLRELASRKFAQFFPSRGFLFSVCPVFFFSWGRFLGFGYGDLFVVLGDDGFLFYCNSKPITRKTLDLYREAFSRANLKATYGWGGNLPSKYYTLLLIILFACKKSLHY